MFCAEPNWKLKIWLFALLSPSMQIINHSDRKSMVCSSLIFGTWLNDVRFVSVQRGWHRGKKQNVKKMSVQLQQKNNWEQSQKSHFGWCSNKTQLPIIADKFQFKWFNRPILSTAQIPLKRARFIQMQPDFYCYSIDILAAFFRTLNVSIILSLRLICLPTICFIFWVTFPQTFCFFCCPSVPFGSDHKRKPTLLRFPLSSS